MDEEKNNQPPEGGESKPSDISDRLSKNEGGGQGSEKNSAGMEPETPLPIDITKFSREQLQQLKAMLAATPEGISRKKEKPRVSIRKIDGNLVVDYKRAYLGLVKDHELNRDVERHLIPVKFLGAKDYANIVYGKFMESERVSCEVLTTRQEVVETVEGQTVSRETGQLVEMVRKEIKFWFTIKLPEGSSQDTVEIEGKIANA